MVIELNFKLSNLMLGKCSENIWALKLYVGKEIYIDCYAFYPNCSIIV